MPIIRKIEEVALLPEGNIDFVGLKPKGDGIDCRLVAEKIFGQTFWLPVIEILLKEDEGEESEVLRVQFPSSESLSALLTAKNVVTLQALADWPTGLNDAVSHAIALALAPSFSLVICAPPTGDEYVEFELSEKDFSCTAQLPLDELTHWFEFCSPQV